MSSSSQEYIMNSRNAILETHNFSKQHWFHNFRSGHQKWRIANSSCWWNYLATSSIYRFLKLKQLNTLAILASIILNLTFLMGSSHKGPSLVAHWNPYIIKSLTSPNDCLFVSEGSVSSKNTLGPYLSGPKAQTDLL